MNEPSLETMIRKLVVECVRDAVRTEVAIFSRDSIRNADDYLSVSKAARVADVAPGTIRAWIRAGRLCGRRAGRVWRVGRSELEQFLAGGATSDEKRAASARAVELRSGHKKRLRTVAA